MSLVERLAVLGGTIISISLTLVIGIWMSTLPGVRNMLNGATGGEILTREPIGVPGWAFLLVFTLFWTVCLYIYYLLHMYANRRVDDYQRRRWVLTVLLGHLLMPVNLIVLLVYWKQHIWSPPVLQIVDVTRADRSS